jgi:hypothetical protein
MTAQVGRTASERFDVDDLPVFPYNPFLYFHYDLLRYSFRTESSGTTLHRALPAHTRGRYLRG